MSPLKRKTARPWRMCRTCHRAGTRTLRGVDRCPAHSLEGVGVCGQCGKKRPLVTCHRYDFRGLKRGGAIPRTTRVKLKNAKRRKSEFARCYHSRERVAWVKSLACTVPGCERGPIENAHSESNGMGHKASYTRILPLCRYHHGYVHLVGIDSFEDRFAVNFARAAARTEQLWLAHRSAGRTHQETK